MITYTWGISQLDCAPSENDLTNVVKVIHWSLTGQDGNGVSASINNSYPLSEPNPEAFNDYSTLTEEIIISWLESNLDVGYLHEVLANKIERNYNPPITPLPLPWIRVEEVVPTEEPIAEEVVPTEEEVITNEYNSNTTEDDGIIQEEIT